MYIQIPAASALPYTRIKSLSFAPEADLTLASVPVNEFRADIITEDAIAVGSAAALYDDLDNLWADYVVMKSERLDRQTVRVVAQSPLILMDRWTVPAEMFQNKSVSSFIYDLCHNIPESGYLYAVDIAVDSFYSGKTVTGFCPEQTARERLQWLCLTVGALVKQCFEATMKLVPAPDVDSSVVESDGVLIPISDTFMKPSVTVKDITRAVAVTGYENFTDVDPGDATGLVWETGVDGNGVTWWFNPVDWTFENEEATSLPGRTVTIDGVTLIGDSATQQVIGWLAAAYFRVGEIQLDCINNGQYYPGQKVRVYTDGETVYAGYIKSCDFSFGLQARSRLVISSNLEYIPVGRLTISYRYSDSFGNFINIGEEEYILPVDEPYDIENHDISWYSGGVPYTYTPNTPRTSGTMGSGHTKVNVNTTEDTSSLPVRLSIWEKPYKLKYDDGETIDYTGIVVRPINRFNMVWKVPRYPDGIIPLSELILPDRVADLDKATGQVIIDITAEDLNAPICFEPVVGDPVNGTRYRYYSSEDETHSTMYVTEIVEGSAIYLYGQHRTGDTPDIFDKVFISRQPFRMNVDRTRPSGWGPWPSQIVSREMVWNGQTLYVAGPIPEPATSTGSGTRVSTPSGVAPSAAQPVDAVTAAAMVMAGGGIMRKGQIIHPKWRRPVDGQLLDVEYGFWIWVRLDQEEEEATET